MHKLFLDIETSGLDINKSAVIEVGYLVVNDFNEVIHQRHYTVIPESIHTPFVWEQQAEDVHRISMAEATKHQFHHLDFCHQFISDIDKDFFCNPVIYGFNVGFDYYMLKRMFDKHSLNIPIYHSLGDLSPMARALLGDDYASSRAMAKVMEITVDEDKAHRAIYDCYLALECYKGLKDISPSANFTKMANLKISWDSLDKSCKEDVFDFMHNWFNQL